MRRSRLPLTALRAFEAAGRHQSFQRAADELAVSEAAVGRQVRDLERLLGQPLFHRHHRAVRLNAVGARLLAETTQSFDRLDAAVMAVLPTANAQEITVSVEPTFATLFLVPRLDRFGREHPEVLVNVEVGAALADFHAGGIALAVRHSVARSAWPRTEARHLLDVRLTPMWRPDLDPQKDPLAVIASTRLLRDESDEPWRTWLMSLKEPVEPNWGPIFSNSAVALQSAALGQGVALGSRLLAARLLEDGQLVAPVSREASHGAYWLLSRDFRKLTDPEALFCDWLLNEVRQAES